MEKHKQTIFLTEKQLRMVIIASTATTEDESKLKNVIIKGLDNELTINEIKEVFTHQYVYAGFPKALNGMLTLSGILEECAKTGIKDTEGRLPSKTEIKDIIHLERKL